MYLGIEYAVIFHTHHRLRRIWLQYCIRKNVSLLIRLFKKFIFEREKELKQGRGRERRGEREFQAGEPDTGLNRIHEIMT